MTALSVYERDCNNTLFLGTGVLAGAIDYYILDKFQRLTKIKAYDEASSSLAT